MWLRSGPLGTDPSQPCAGGSVGTLMQPSHAAQCDHSRNPRRRAVRPDGACHARGGGGCRAERSNGAQRAHTATREGGGEGGMKYRCNERTESVAHVAPAREKRPATQEPAHVADTAPVPDVCETTNECGWARVGAGGVVGSSAVTHKVAGVARHGRRGASGRHVSPGRCHGAAARGAGKKGQAGMSGHCATASNGRHSRGCSSG
jgi:hypothetical protein